MTWISIKVKITKKPTQKKQADNFEEKADF